MSVHELNLPPDEPLPAFPLGQLQRWAEQRPLQIALRHRRRGVWKAWRWIDVQREVERLAAALREQGLEPGARLALCGAFEPTLLLLALAGQHLGARVLTVSRQAKGEALRRLLRQARPAFAYVQRRENVSDWLEAGDTSQPLRLFSAQAAARVRGAWQVLPLSVLLAGEPAEALSLGWRQAAGAPLAWCDEGTEWRDGLGHILALWLKQGTGFAFPETSESASRDRREVAPAVLLLSEPRLQALAAEIDSRLAPPGSWRRRLCDWTLANPQQAPRRWIKARVRELLGFRRLQRILVGAPAPAASGPVWLSEYLERAA